METHTWPWMPRLLGGYLCLDFVNTLDPRFGESRLDALASYEHLVAWGVHASILSEEQGLKLLDEAQRQKLAALETFTHAIEVREMLYRIFEAIVNQEETSGSDLTLLKQEYLSALSHASLFPTDQAYQWGWPQHSPALDQVLWPVLESAITLLTTKDLTRLHQCALEECGWIFYDTSKGGQRRWCSMEGCGSRGKMRRMYQRKKDSKT